MVAARGPTAQEYLSHVLLPHGLIIDRTEKLAADIRAAYPTSTPHFLVVLKVRGWALASHASSPPRRHPSATCPTSQAPTQGGSEFATDLTRAVRSMHAHHTSTHLPFTVDYVRVKSYEGTESTGKGEGVAAEVATMAAEWARIRKRDATKATHQAIAANVLQHLPASPDLARQPPATRSAHHTIRRPQPWRHASHRHGAYGRRRRLLPHQRRHHPLSRHVCPLQ